MSTLKFILSILFIFLVLSNSYANDIINFKHNIKNFSQAKKQLKKIYKNNQVTFYCGCNFKEQKRNNQYKLIIDNNTCGYIPKKKNKNFGFVEWEHIMPASAFAKNLKCWNDKICTNKNNKTFKGRKCCKKIDKHFNYMESDLHNIAPAISELNRDRSNYIFDNIKNEILLYGSCDFEVDKRNKIVEPAPHTKGFIARAYLYMNDTYNLNLSNKEIEKFKSWDNQYKPDKWEKERNNLIKKIQGNSNKYIDKYN